MYSCHVEWQEERNDRLVAEHPSGFKMVRPKDAAMSVPLFCPSCYKQMRTSGDAHSFRKYEVCEECEIVLALTGEE